MIDVDSTIRLSELELYPESVPPSVVRDMAIALRILAWGGDIITRGQTLQYFGFLNDTPTTLQEYIDKKNGNHL